MAEEGTEGTGTTEGQPGEGTPGEGTTQDTGTEGIGEGQPEGGQGTTQDTGTQMTEETFFDPATLEGKPELQAAYKQMQKAFGKKMEGIKGEREKVNAYNAFMTNPLQEVQKLASQMGYQLNRVGDQTQTTEQGLDNWEPKSWDEVIEKVSENVLNKSNQQMQPVVSEIQKLRKNNLETFLDNNATDWRQYEDTMMEKLRAHPSLVQDPIALYTLSVPPEVLESRATQRALQKMKDKGLSSQVSGSSTTTKKPGAGLPDKSLTFDEAVTAAKAKLAEEGIKAPS